MAGQRIAINCGGGVPGLNGRTVGAATAAQEVGWMVVCVREGKHVSPVSKARARLRDGSRPAVRRCCMVIKIER